MLLADYFESEDDKNRGKKRRKESEDDKNRGKKRRKESEDEEKDERYEKTLNELKQKLKEKEAEIKKLEKTLKPKSKKAKKDDEDDIEDKVDVVAVGYKVDDVRPNSHLNGGYGIAIIEDMHGYGNSFSKEDVSYFFTL